MAKKDTTIKKERTGHGRFAAAAGCVAAGVDRYVRPRYRKPSKAPTNHGGGKKGNQGGIVRHPDLELKLEIFLSIREPGREYTQREIADACGCSRGLIWMLEKRAMKKLRAALSKVLNREDDEPHISERSGE